MVPYLRLRLYPDVLLDFTDKEKHQLARSSLGALEVIRRKKL